MKKIIQKIKNNWLAFILFSIFFFLRFYQVPQRFFFGIDEEYSSLLALSIIKDFHIIWIGLSAANTGFYVGPGIIYVHSFLLWLSRLDPLILGYTASLIGFIFLIIFYFIVKQLFNKKIAIISTFIYGISPFVLSYDRRFWNSTFVPLTVMLFFYSLVKFRKNPNWLIVIAILLALSFHIHASLFVFIPITLTLLLLKLFNKHKSMDFNVFQFISTCFISVISFLIIYSPLIVFDFVHNFDNLKTPLRLLQNMGRGTNENLFLSHFQIMSDSFTRFLMIPDSWMLIKFIAIIMIFCFFVRFFQTYTLKGKHPALSTIILFYLIMFVLYPGNILDYYYIGFFPFLAIIFGMFLEKINKYLLIIITTLSAIASVVVMVNQPNTGGLESKKILIKQTINAVGNNSYYLDTNKNYLYFGGWRYLFEAYGKRPDSSQADQIFGWIYKKEILPDKPKLKVIVTEGKYGVYHSNIVENK